MNKNLLFSYLAGTVLGMATVLPGAAQHTAQAPAEAAVGDAEGVAEFDPHAERVRARAATGRFTAATARTRSA